MNTYRNSLTDLGVREDELEPFLEALEAMHTMVPTLSAPVGSKLEDGRFRLTWYEHLALRRFDLEIREGVAVLYLKHAHSKSYMETYPMEVYREWQQKRGR